MKNGKVKIEWREDATKTLPVSDLCGQALSCLVPWELLLASVGCKECKKG